MYLRSAISGLLLCLAGCTVNPGIVDMGDYQLDKRSPAQAAYPRVKIVVIHYTAENFERSLKVLRGDAVSAHYLLPALPPERQGKPVIWQLVPEEKLAWHAGVSFWRGSTRLNDISVGIELENIGFTLHEGERRFSPFEPAQIAALEKLLSDIVARYQIAPQNIVAHSDIAPQRKTDPGPLFPWKQLADRGIGAWPLAERVTFYLNGRDPYASVDSANLLDLLSRYGYQTGLALTSQQQQQVISAFQMHFRPQDYSGRADAETEAIAQALLERYGEG